jgi:hypothetical protein
MACSGRLATADELRTSPMVCLDIPIDAGEAVAQTAMLEAALDYASADVYAAMAASGQCDCTLAGWAQSYLAKIAILDALVLQRCPCVRGLLTAEEKQMWLNWLSDQFMAIRKGDLALCDGATGNDFPAIAWAEMSLTAFNAAKIVRNHYLRGL